MITNSMISSVLKLVVDGEDHELYELNTRYRFSYSQAKEAVESLSDVGVLELSGHFFKLTPHIEKEQLVYLYRNIRHRSLNLEQDVIDGYKKKSLELNELVKPNLDRLDEQLRVDE
ncbi:hypothetical protein [Marinomonas sp.]|uniref:hypothetical protein n=1 Tax=Gammaproteobacteria TaxID=1236 RepID=UPI00337E2DBA|nr:conserved hypothetical protein [Vibrio chagasii]CAH7024255.1 conserved hypothetical protein [Vibrio chagasii]CAH7030011.1 conserved hypothetical protein [Vibrio chagasii]CAH7089044.1 conserved hypothetical protein [Vibrio chagasii]CAH7274143.1 conserved hypothetical protein [Vibrio chagasii]